jgi:hypothetical protein
MKRPPANLFVGFKTARAIPLNSNVRRDYLIQSTLDPAVRHIEYHPTLRIDDSIQQIDALIIDSDFGRLAIDLVDARPTCDPATEGLMHLAFSEGCSGIQVVTEADVRREPRFSTAREVWRHRHVSVHTDDREAVLAVLDQEGPIPIRSLGGLIHTRRDIETVVYCLACDGSLSLDVAQGLDDRTVIRVGSRPVADFGRLAYGT